MYGKIFNTYPKAKFILECFMTQEMYNKAVKR